MLNTIIMEINTMVALNNCPYIVKLYGICFHPNQDIDIVMETLDGDISDIKLTSQVNEYMIQSILTAVSTMEELNLVHNDIHPGNIFYANTSHGKIFKLGDFGDVSYLDPRNSNIDYVQTLFDDDYLRNIHRISQLFVPCFVEKIVDISHLNKERYKNAINFIDNMLANPGHMIYSPIDNGLYDELSSMISEMKGRIIYTQHHI